MEKMKWETPKLSVLNVQKTYEPGSGEEDDLAHS
jgi:hypothetical protein